MIPKRFDVMWAAIARTASNRLRQMALAAGVAGVVAFGLLSVVPILAQSSPPANAPLPSFEVVSVKRSRSGENTAFHAAPNRLIIRNTLMEYIIEISYGHDLGEFGFTELAHDQTVGGPSWVYPGEFDYEGYDIDAKVDDSLAEKFGKDCGADAFAHHGCAYRSQMLLMLQSLLADRCKLRVRHETKEGPVYALVIAKGGPKFLHTKFTVYSYAAMAQNPALRPPCPAGMVCVQQYTSMGLLADWLARSWRIGRPVIDQTGLQGGYYIKLQYVPEQTGSPTAEIGSAPPLGPSGPSIFTAFQQQLGLKLVPTKGPVDSLVIEHIERPSEN
jgi:uncharacterized protein (TIGR03435 family)